MKTDSPATKIASNFVTVVLRMFSVSNISQFFCLRCALGHDYTVFAIIYPLFILVLLRWSHASAITVAARNLCMSQCSSRSQSSQMRDNNLSSPNSSILESCVPKKWALFADYHDVTAHGLSIHYCLRMSIHASLRAAFCADSNISERVSVWVVSTVWVYGNACLESIDSRSSIKRIWWSVPRSPLRPDSTVFALDHDTLMSASTALPPIHSAWISGHAAQVKEHLHLKKNFILSSVSACSH